MDEIHKKKSVTNDRFWKIVRGPLLVFWAVHKNWSTYVYVTILGIEESPVGLIGWHSSLLGIEELPVGLEIDTLPSRTQSTLLAELKEMINLSNESSLHRYMNNNEYTTVIRRYTLTNNYFLQNFSTMGGGITLPLSLPN